MNKLLNAPHLYKIGAVWRLATDAKLIRKKLPLCTAAPPKPTPNFAEFTERYAKLYFRMALSLRYQKLYGPDPIAGCAALLRCMYFGYGKDLGPIARALAIGILDKADPTPHDLSQFLQSPVPGRITARLRSRKRKRKPAVLKCRLHPVQIGARRTRCAVCKEIRDRKK